MNYFVCLVCCVLLTVSWVTAENLRPIVGILSVGPTSSDCPTYYKGQKLGDGNGCFDAVYVKWLEGSGVRVVPIPYTTPAAQLDYLFNGLNGILFTGGGLNLTFSSTYLQTANYLFQKGLQANANGDYFPIWGTCMGFQTLNILAAQDISVLSTYAFDSENYTIPLNFTDAAPSSRMYGSLPVDYYEIFATENITPNLHHDGVTPDSFYGNNKLSSTFTVLSTNVDRKGKEFVSSMEGQNGLPFYGVQYHPERASYDWTLGYGLPHTGDAVAIYQGLVDFFASEVRKNKHSFASTSEEESLLIYNYTPRFLGGSSQAYFF